MAEFRIDNVAQRVLDAADTFITSQGCFGAREVIGRDYDLVSLRFLSKA